MCKGTETGPIQNKCNLDTTNIRPAAEKPNHRDWATSKQHQTEHRQTSAANKGYPHHRNCPTFIQFKLSKNKCRPPSFPCCNAFLFHLRHHLLAKPISISCPSSSPWHNAFLLHLFVHLLVATHFYSITLFIYFLQHTLSSAPCPSPCCNPFFFISLFFCLSQQISLHLFVYLLAANHFFFICLLSHCCNTFPSHDLVHLLVATHVLFMYLFLFLFQHIPSPSLCTSPSLQFITSPISWLSLWCNPFLFHLVVHLLVATHCLSPLVSSLPCLSVRCKPCLFHPLVHILVAIHFFFISLFTSLSQQILSAYLCSSPCCNAFVLHLLVHLLVTTYFFSISCSFRTCNLFLFISLFISLRI